MKKLIFLFLCIICSLFSFSKPKNCVPHENDTTCLLEYNRGNLWQIKETGNAIVATAITEAEDDGGTNYRLMIFVHNSGPERFDFFPESITATSHQKGVKKNEKMHIYSCKEYQDKIDRQQTWSSILVGFSAGLSTGFGENNNPTSTLNTLLTLDISNKLIDRRQEAMIIEYLQNETISPGETLVGYMNIEKKGVYAITVNLPVNGNSAEFTWYLRER